MTDAFISYSRKDLIFVRQLFEALEKTGHDSWIDWGNIPTGAQFLQEIYEGIEHADTFLLIVTPDALISEICNYEIAHAIKQNKRIIPVIRHEIQIESIAGHWFDKPWEATARNNWQTIKHLNWQLFRKEDNFDNAFAALIDALDTNIEYVKTHTRILVRAREWEKAGHNPDYLLRGDDLHQMEQWLEASRTMLPQPTELQTQYILVSIEERQKQREKELAKQEDFQKRRQQLLTGIANEMRGPLNALRASARLLTRAIAEKADRGNEKSGIVNELSETLVMNVDYLSRNLEALLDIARFNRGTINLHREPAIIMELIKKQVKSLQPYAQEKNITLTLENRIPGDDFQLSIDSRRLAQAVLNLLSNALKYTEPGGRVNVKLSCPDNSLQIDVTDTGIGIRPERLKTIFEPFSRTQSEAIAGSGTGLGLAVAKQIVKSHGGHITVDSEPGNGSTFSIILPLQSEAN